MSEAPPPSDELVDLAFTALEHGLQSIADGGGPLVPFVLVDGQDGRQLSRFASETLEESIEEGRRQVRESGALRAAIAYEGYLTVDGGRLDAVLVEASERDAESAVVFAQCYRPARRFRGTLEPLGNAVLLPERPASFI